MESFVKVLLIYCNLVHVVAEGFVAGTVVFAEEVIDGGSTCWRKQARK